MKKLPFNSTTTQLLPNSTEMLKRLIKYGIIAALVIAIALLLKNTWLPSVMNIFKPKPVVIEDTPILIKQINELAQLCTITVFDEVVADSVEIRSKSEKITTAIHLCA